MEVNVKEARGRFSALLKQVQEGDEVVILRHGKEVARLVPPRRRRRQSLTSLKDFRGSIRISGKPLSNSVIRAREEERF